MRGADAEADRGDHQRGQDRVAAQAAPGQPEVVAEHGGSPQALAASCGGGLAQARRVVEVGDLAVDDVHVALRARGELRIVGDHHDGGALRVDLLEQLHHAARHQRVEVAGRLVGQQQARLAGQRARDRHALLLAAGQLGRVVLHARAQAHAGQRLLDAAPALGGVEAAVAQRHVDVVEQVEVGDQVEALEDEADLLVAQRASARRRPRARARRRRRAVTRRR